MACVVRSCFFTILHFWKFHYLIRKSFSKRKASPSRRSKSNVISLETIFFRVNSKFIHSDVSTLLRKREDSWRTSHVKWRMYLNVLSNNSTLYQVFTNSDHFIKRHFLGLSGTYIIGLLKLRCPQNPTIPTKDFVQKSKLT